MTKSVPPAIFAQLRTREAAVEAGTSGMFTTSELCRLLSVSNQAVSLWVAKGTIPHFRLGTLLRFDPTQIIAWMEQRQSA